MFGAGNPQLGGAGYGRQVTTDQRRGVEPQAGQDFGAAYAIRPGDQALVLSIPQHEPVDRAVEYPPDDVFADAVAEVRRERGVQVDADRASRHLDD